RKFDDPRNARSHRRHLEHTQRDEVMKYTTIGTDPRPVSVLAMGTHMNLGYSLNEAEASALVAAAIDGGINLFDTADAYADGAAETALGQCLKPYAREPLWI